MGPHGNGKPNDNGTRFTGWMRSHAATAVNTQNEEGPTYVAANNVGKTIDYIIIPIDFRPAVNSCATWKSSTKRVAATPYAVDHLCLVTCFWIPRRRSADTAPLSQWDRDKLSLEMKEGGKDRQS